MMMNTGFTVPGTSEGHPYQPVTTAIVAQLRAIVGERYVIYGEPERMLDYAHDEVAGEEYAHSPEAVVKPDMAAEIAEIMRLANRERIPVTPRGAGSGLSCGEVTDDLIAAGFSLENGSGSSAGGDLLFVGYQALLTGDVAGDADLAGGAVKIAGSIGGDVSVDVGGAEPGAGMPPGFPFAPGLPTVPSV